MGGEKDAHALYLRHLFISPYLYLIFSISTFSVVISVQRFAHTSACG